MNHELYHYGVKGMKWGVRRTPEQLAILRGDSSVTKKVKKDYNSMTDQEFKRRYQTSKKTYARRVAKYGDPYKNAPLAKLGRKLADKEKRKKQAKGAQFANNYINYLNKTLSSESAELDAPYRQQIGDGVYANWSSKRAFIQAEINRVSRDLESGRGLDFYYEDGRKVNVRYG